VQDSILIELFSLMQMLGNFGAKTNTVSQFTVDFHLVNGLLVPNKFVI